ncbi:CbiQ family ECF transporter T component [Pseudodesulfovibrio portus]|uniref:Cobalt transport protein n=1 Tax=Pseudodesulfovibrio portus TaxID=231439 RepID=A0ABM8AP12_9BACT|nr:CbiQ family ECF transporter T component [Pseudodesulfovibrio portus]BDQ33147.1 hypothetical protein JCM14722_06890 [Pseudodesulfovibrio portus]
MRAVADGLRALDPRLKLAAALVLGPCLWKVHVASAAFCALVFLFLVPMLSASRPLGSRMVKSLFFFIFLWVAVKSGVDAMTGVPSEYILADAGQLAVRLTGLVLLGLVLALSTSPRTIGLAVAWYIRPLVGRERAWRVALSLALMVHFLPICLSTVIGVRDALDRRCPEMGGIMKARVIPQAVIRNLGQKTWSQTLAVASRGLEGPEAWEADFRWAALDLVWACLIAIVVVLLFIP